MGFRKGAYAKVWEVTPMSDTSTKLRVSISRKNKQTGNYEQDFSGFILCIGTACAAKAAKLNKGDSIRLGDCDVTTWYNKETGTNYTNFKIFSFDQDEESGQTQSRNQTSPPPDEVGGVDEPDYPEHDDRLPF